jgi:erythronate-4-phosphate dehydrogenase
LLGTDELCALRADALLINASRGAVVDNAALLALMEQGKFGAQVILDVWEGEPCISEPLLRRVALASPHIAGYSLDGKILATRMLCESLAEYFQLPALNSDSPVADAAPAALVAAVNGAALVRCLLQQRYDISEDDALLREATLGPSPARAAVAFDQLRKTYRERRELYGTRVCGQLTDTRDLQLVKALGCSFDSNGLST